jgi:hypothetical protein
MPKGSPLRTTHSRTKPLNSPSNHPKSSSAFTSSATLESQDNATLIPPFFAVATQKQNGGPYVHAPWENITRSKHARSPCSPPAPPSRSPRFETSKEAFRFVPNIPSKYPLKLFAMNLSNPTLWSEGEALWASISFLHWRAASQRCASPPI